MENEVIDLKPLGYRKEELPVILAGMKKIWLLDV
jgi:hypothetical protein